MDFIDFEKQIAKNILYLFYKISSFIDINYNMELLYNGKNEVKFRRGSQTLVTFYFKDNMLTVLIIFGKKEREIFETSEYKFSDYIANYYQNSKTYHDGKWMFIDIGDDTYIGDIVELIKIKKKPDPNVITLCGYKCDLCKAYSKNIKKDDKRRELSYVWQKYYDLDIPEKDIYCDGCRSKKNAMLLDSACPVRACVSQKNLHSCLDCGQYPCDVFDMRKGLSLSDAKQKLADKFDINEFNEYLLAYDNKTRLDNAKKG